MNYAKVPKLTRDQLRVGGQHGRRRGAEVGEGEGEAEVGVRVTEPGLHTSRVTWSGVTCLLCATCTAWPTSSCRAASSPASASSEAVARWIRPDEVRWATVTFNKD